MANDGNIKGQTVYDKSNSNFNIDNANEAPSVSVDYPNGGEKLKEEVRINWTASDPDADTLTHSVYYSDAAGVTWNLLVADFAGDHYDWDTTAVAYAPHLSGPTCPRS